MQRPSDVRDLWMSVNFVKQTHRATLTHINEVSTLSELTLHKSGRKQTLEFRFLL